MIFNNITLFTCISDQINADSKNFSKKKKKLTDSKLMNGCVYHNVVSTSIVSTLLTLDPYRSLF